MFDRGRKDSSKTGFLSKLGFGKGKGKGLKKKIEIFDFGFFFFVLFLFFVLDCFQRTISIDYSENQCFEMFSGLFSLMDVFFVNDSL